MPPGRGRPALQHARETRRLSSLQVARGRGYSSRVTISYMYVTNNVKNASYNIHMYK